MLALQGCLSETDLRNDPSPIVATLSRLSACPEKLPRVASSAANFSLWNSVIFEHQLLRRRGTHFLSLFGSLPVQNLNGNSLADMQVQQRQLAGNCPPSYTKTFFKMRGRLRLVETCRAGIRPGGLAALMDYFD